MTHQAVYHWLFQSTPPRRGRLASAVCLCLPTSFNPRPREGGDPSKHLPFAPCHSRFQSTPPRRGRQAVAGGSAATTRCFNPRPREGGDPLMQRPQPNPRQFQSTPPRRGRRPFLTDRNGRCRVSIHAPAKGATALCQDVRVLALVSIHAPAKGATAPPWRGR